MGARTCLLCGKPLSRIWAGAGEDFCSREHRNQYRLRRGMDSLLEANKVANAMRRRESPRQIPVARLQGPSSQRGFFDPQIPRESRMAGFSPPQVRPARPLGIAARGFLPQPPNSGMERPLHVLDATPLTFRAQPPLAPAVELRLPARVAQAPASAVAHGAADAESKRRVLILPWRGARRTFAGEIRRRAASPGKTNPLESARPASGVAAAAKGRALRVSMASGFRIPEWKLRTVSLGRPEIAGMQWPELRRLDPRLAAAQSLPSEASVEMLTPAMCIPAVPPADLRRRLRSPGVLGIAIHFVGSAPEHWSTVVPFGNPDESLAKERR